MTRNVRRCVQVTSAYSKLDPETSNLNRPPCYPPAVPVASPRLKPKTARHAVLVRVTHWITVLCFFALLLSGLEIVISHPRFYWGEVGNDNTHPLFIIPIPSSRDMVPTGYRLIMPDQNGWSRALHFEAAWFVVLAGLAYVLWGLFTGHFRRNLWPERGEKVWPAIRRVLTRYLRRAPPGEEEAYSYNIVQRLSYLAVIFVLFPLMIWTGLAMSPSFTSVFPESVILLGGRQTARTLHFFITGLLTLFLVVHVAMLVLAGFWSRMRAMITGRAGPEQQLGKDRL